MFEQNKLLNLTYKQSIIFSPIVGTLVGSFVYTVLMSIYISMAFSESSNSTDLFKVMLLLVPFISGLLLIASYILLTPFLFFLKTKIEHKLKTTKNISTVVGIFTFVFFVLSILSFIVFYHFSDNLMNSFSISISLLASLSIGISFFMLTTMHLRIKKYR